jgi:hypothetical protein
MATTSKPPTLTRDQVDNPSAADEAAGNGQRGYGQRGGAGLSRGTQARLKEKADRDDRDFRRADAAAYRRATQGIPDAETLDAVLALGGDATRSSPVREQVLPDADPGLTTTTGAHRTPIDPTTAAVPASENSEIARRIAGTPTVGSRQRGTPETRYKKSDRPELDALPERDELDAEQDEDGTREPAPDHPAY